MTTAVFEVKTIGAIGDGIYSNTKIFRAAALNCAEAGGGTIIVPPGRYLTGPFQLFSNTELKLEPGAIIIASTDINEYFQDHNSMESPRIGLIYARNAENISISGRGVIDFQGTAFMNMQARTPWADFDRQATRQKERYLQETKEIGDGPVAVTDRPGNLLQFLNCQNISLTQVTLENAPNWTVHFGQSRDIFVHAIRILNNLFIPNSDGIHCAACANVHISDCHIESGDDSIAVTTLSQIGQISENITVSNCTLVSRSAGIRVGYGEDDIRNCLFQNLTIKSNRGIGIFARSPMTISDISFDHITMQTRLHDGQWWGHGEPIHISSTKMSEELATGKIKNISFTNIIAHSESGVLIYAPQPGLLEQIRLKNFHLTLKNSPLAESYGGNFDLRPAVALEERVFSHDEGGLFALNAAYLTVEAMTLEWEGKPNKTFGYGVYAEDCPNIQVRDFVCPNPQVAQKLRSVELNNC